MPVDVEGSRGVGVPHGGLHRFYVSTRADQQRREVVPEIVEGEPFRQAFDFLAGAGDGVRDILRCARLTATVGDHHVGAIFLHRCC